MHQMLLRRTDRMVDLRRPLLLTSRIAFSSRSMVAGLILSRPARTSGSSCKCPCRSIELTITGMICFSLFGANPIRCFPHHDERLLRGLIVDGLDLEITIEHAPVFRVDERTAILALFV